MKRLIDWWRSVHPKRIEAIGIGFILLAAAWEFGVLSGSLRRVSDGAFLDIDQKLKHIWSALGSPDAREYVSKSMRSFWDTVRVNDRMKDIRGAYLVDYINYIRFGMFCIGSILIIAAKWREGSK